MTIQLISHGIGLLNKLASAPSNVDISKSNSSARLDPGPLSLKAAVQSFYSVPSRRPGGITRQQHRMSPEARALGGDQFRILAMAIGARMLQHPGKHGAAESSIDCQALPLVAASTMYPPVRTIANKVVGMVARSRLAQALLSSRGIGKSFLTRQSQAMNAPVLDPMLEAASMFKEALEHLALPEGSTVNAVNATRINTDVTAALIGAWLPRTEQFATEIADKRASQAGKV